MPNIEIKAAYENLANARKKCAELGAVFVGQDQQVDTYFTVAHGHLKLRAASYQQLAARA